MANRILLVDDEEIIRFSFKSHLEKQGYEILSAGNYDSAFEIITSTNLDLIITDIILGGHTGIDILREVKAQGHDCPVIMITGEPNVSTATEAVRLGAFDYISKPVLKEDLLRVTDHAIKHKSLIDKNRRLEEEKETNRQNLEAIFGSIKDAIITVDPDLKVIEANHAVKTICGFAPTDIIMEQFADKSKLCRKTCHGVLKQTLENQTPVKDVPVDCHHMEHTGQVVLLTTSLLKDSNAEQYRGAVLVIRDVTRLTDLERELKDRYKFHNIIGKSSQMQGVYSLLEDLSNTETAVLITGESGTGKELAARALHFNGPRADNPLVTVNCSTLSENLLESELFGHVRGSFTGAVGDKEGRFQMADKGSIFLDEIGDIAPSMQLKLLRVLQEHSFERVGDSKTIKVDVRVIAVTNCNLREKVKAGEFREDLYYRLNVVEVILPPLRERREDIPLLMNNFFNRFSKKFNKNIEGISDEVLDIFMQYSWPGNIRELEHAIEHGFVLCHDQFINIDHLPREIKKISDNNMLLQKSASPQNLDHPFDQMSIQDTDDSVQSSANDLAPMPDEVLDALEQTDWNKAKAARLLGVSRPTLYRKIKEYNLEKLI